MKHTIIIAFWLLVISVSLAFFVNYLPLYPHKTSLEDKALAVSILNDVEVEEYWVSRIQDVGGTESYEEFVDLEGYIYDGSEHKRAHMFGGALYREKGIDLFSVCDSRFHYGCFHEFLGRAITEHGINVIDRLSNACVNKFGERGVLCQHGIGHGLLSYLGYDLDTLTEALLVCRNLDEQGERDPVRGCEGGVYMEFNMRTMLDEEDEVRHLDDSSFPCSVLPTSFKEGCIFWQPQWWQENLMREQKGYSENEYAIYSTMGSWCREFTNDKHLLQSCFAGIGNFGSGGVDYELSAIANLCRNSSGGNQSHDLLCRIRGFLKTPTQRLNNQSSGDVCRGLISTLERYCNEFILGRGDDTFIGDDGNVVKLSHIIYLKPLNLKTSSEE